MAEVALDFQDQAGRAALGIARLPGQDLLGERVHASRGLAGTDGSENGQSGIEAPLRDNEPGRVRDFDGLYRVVNLPDNDARAGVFVGRKGQGGSNLRAVRLLPTFSNQTRQTEMKNSPPTMRATAGAA